MTLSAEQQARRAPAYLIVGRALWPIGDTRIAHAYLQAVYLPPSRCRVLPRCNVLYDDWQYDEVHGCLMRRRRPPAPPPAPPPAGRYLHMMEKARCLRAEYEQFVRRLDLDYPVSVLSADGREPRMPKDGRCQLRVAGRIILVNRHQGMAYLLRTDYQVVSTMKLLSTAAPNEYWATERSCPLPPPTESWEQAVVDALLPGEVC